MCDEVGAHSRSLVHSLCYICPFCYASLSLVTPHRFVSEQRADDREQHSITHLLIKVLAQASHSWLTAMDTDALDDTVPATVQGGGALGESEVASDVGNGINALLALSEQVRGCHKG